MSVAWAKISGEVVRNSFYAAEILRRPQIAVRETFEEDENVMDVSFFSTTSFFGSDEVSSEEKDCNDIDGFSSDDDE